MRIRAFYRDSDRANDSSVRAKIVDLARASPEGHLHNPVRVGVGLGPLDCFAADGMSDLERALPDPFLHAPMWLVTHVDNHRSARVRAV